jgi:hypothetical protein
MRNIAWLIAGAPILLVLSSPCRSGPLPHNQTEAIQVLADVTLIDSQCRKVSADFGLAFRYAEEQGVRGVDVMPLGRRRASFDAASEHRLGTTPVAELCGSLLQRYVQNFPGLFAQR